MKRTYPVTLAECARAAAAIAKLVAPDLLAADLTLVSVPGHLPTTTLGPTTAAEAVTQALHRAGFGTALWPALYRRTVIAKSA